MDSSMPSWIHKTTISDDLLKEIYASDQDMYPAPLPYERLKGWIEASPDLSICFEATPEEGGDPVPVGAVIVFPLLKKYWDEILVGKLKEPNIDSATMFPSDAEAEVGLHVFHVERFDSTNPSGRLRRFAEFALEDTREIVRRKGWKIVGYSALTATPTGRAVCKRMGFKATGYEEIFVSSDAAGDATQHIEIISIYPGQGDHVQDAEKMGLVLCKSEMVVRYLNDQFLDSV